VRDETLEVLVVSSGGTYGIPLATIDRLEPAGRSAAFGGGAPPPAPPGDRGVGSAGLAAAAVPLAESLGAAGGEGERARSTHAVITKEGAAALVEGSGELLELRLSRVRRLPRVLQRPGIIAAAVLGPSTVLLLVDLDRIASRKEPTC
jgi:hypothetical protein